MSTSKRPSRQILRLTKLLAHAPLYFIIVRKKTQSDGTDWSDPRTWGPLVHHGHRLWAAMSPAFWVYVYKVQRCPQLSSHDWMTCPYAHMGERARRRDPRRFPYLALTSPEHRASQEKHQHHHLFSWTGGGAVPTCVRGLRCRYAHGVFELWLHPEKFRTVMCGGGPWCRRRVCFFAHFPSELRRENDPVPLVGMPPPPRVLRSPAAPAVSLPRRVDRIMKAMPGKLRLYNGAAGASSSSPTSSPAAAIAVATAAPEPALPQVSLKDEDPAGENGLCACDSEDDGSVAGDYPHFDLIKDMVI